MCVHVLLNNLIKVVTYYFEYSQRTLGLYKIKQKLMRVFTITMWNFFHFLKDKYIEKYLNEKNALL